MVPVVAEDEQRLVVTYTVRRTPDKGATCPGNRPLGQTFTWEHALENRPLLDGSCPRPEDGTECEAQQRGEAFLIRDSDLSDEERRSQFRDVLDSVVAPTLQRTRLIADLKDPAVIGRFAMGADAYHRLGLRGSLGETRG